MYEKEREREERGRNGWGVGWGGGCSTIMMDWLRRGASTLISTMPNLNPGVGFFAKWGV